MPIRKVLAIFLPALGLSMALYRATEVSEPFFLHADWAFNDFFSAIYYPIVAVLAGENPYNLTEFVNKYPVIFAFPLFLPATFLVHLPFGLLSPSLAIQSYFLTLVCMSALLATISLRLTGVRAGLATIFIVFGFVLISRPGHSNLLLGQTALQFTLAAYVVVYCTGRPKWLGVAALVFCAIKPTFGVPLGLLLLSQRKFRIVTLAVFVSLVINVPMVLLLARGEGGLIPFFNEALANFRGWGGNAYVIPATSATLIDLGSLIGRLSGESLGMFGRVAVFALTIVFAAAAWARGERAEDTRQLALGIVLLAVLLCVYHQMYDLVLLTAPFVAMVGRRFPERFYSGWHYPVSLALLCFLGLDYLSGESVIGRLEHGSAVWLLLASANGAALLLLFATWLHALFVAAPAVAATRSADTP